MSDSWGFSIKWYIRYFINGILCIFFNNFVGNRGLEDLLFKEYNW